MAEPRIAVLVSLGRHPVSGAVRWSRNDGAALALARRLGGASVAVLHAGDPDEPALRGYLALGAPASRPSTCRATGTCWIRLPPC